MHHAHAASPGRIGRLVRTSLRAVVAGLLIWGCVPPPPGFPPYVPPPPPPVPPEPVRLPDRLDTDSLLSWAVEEERVLVVDKSCQLLRVYDYGRLVRSALGLSRPSLEVRWRARRDMLREIGLIAAGETPPD